MKIIWTVDFLKRAPPPISITKALTNRETMRFNEKVPRSILIFDYSNKLGEP